MTAAVELQTRQNEDRLLKLLAGQRHLYSHVKVARAFRLACMLLGSAGVSLVLFISPDQTVKASAALVGAALAIAGFVLERFESPWVKQAARMQEVFDTELFCLNWNPVIAGAAPATEEIEAEARKFRGDRAELRDWYGDVGGIPANISVLLCQRTNVGWDSRARRKYAITVGVATGVAVVAILGLGIATGASLLDWVLLLAVPCQAIIQYGVKVSMDNFMMAREREPIGKAIDAAISNALSGDAPNLECLRVFQDQIFLLRCKTTLVPDAWHRLVRPEFQADMDAALQEFRRRASTHGAETASAAPRKDQRL